MQRAIWFSRRSIALHVLIVIVVPCFAALCIWQVRRALGGNELSWAYVFEWPFFAGYAIYMWWRFVHEAPPESQLTSASPSRSSLTASPAPAASPALSASLDSTASPDSTGGRGIGDADDGDNDDDAAERAAYNSYLAALAQRDARKQWR